MNFRVDYEPASKTGKLVKKVGRKVSIAGRIVAITGTLPNMTRRQAEWWVTNKKKAAYSSIVSRRVSMLILGKTRGRAQTQKQRTASRLGIQTVRFEEIA